MMKKKVELPIGSKKKFKKKYEKHESVLNEVIVNCRYLKKRGCTSAACGEDLDVQSDTVSGNEEVRNSVFCQCEKDGKYISEISSIVLSSGFE